MSSSKGASPQSNPPASGTGSVDFILRTAMERQSGNKRPIRPKLVDDTLLGDDSDDSDFNVDDQEQGSGSGTESGSDDSDSSPDGTSSASAASESDAEEPSNSKSFTLRETLKKLNDEAPSFDVPNNSKPKKTKKPSKSAKKQPAATKNSKKISKHSALKKGEMPSDNKKEKRKSERNPYAGSIMDRVFKATSAMRDIRSDIDLNRKICSFCLGEKSDRSNEIVECDSCKITVHEGCYGMSDSLSLSSSSGSSSSTEPWFCDYCKNPDGRWVCALCPNPGGLLKATSDDRFVHLICAHYTPGVISVIDNKANLGKIPYSKWGNKPCTLCQCVRFANTGVTVKCDAGMCKSFLHISCAQKSGLLSDPGAYLGNDEADPFFASCKLHGHKDQAKHRATLFKVLQEQLRIKRDKATVNLSPTAKQNQGRIQAKLSKIRAKVAAKQIPHSTLVQSTVNGTKLPLRRPCNPTLVPKPRNLKSCAYSVSRFLHKIERMGEDITSLELEEKNERIVANIKKRWNVLPSLTVEFAAYYFDREARIDSLSKQCEVLIKENENLNDRQIALNTVLENEAVDHMEIMDDTFTLDSKLSDFKDILKSLGPGNKLINTSALLKGLPPRAKSPVRKTPVAIKPKGNIKEKSARGKSDSKKKPHCVGPPLDLIGQGRLTLHVCATCKKSDQQHLITRCDHCTKNYHLGCLDPPLTRMPRRTRLCGWMCSDCCDEESEKEKEEAAVIDTDAPRSLRGRTKLKRPEKYREGDELEEDGGNVKEKPEVKPVPALTPLVLEVETGSSSLQPTQSMEKLSNQFRKNNSLGNGTAKPASRAVKRKGESLLSHGATGRLNSSPPIKKEKVSPNAANANSRKSRDGAVLNSPTSFVPIRPKPKGIEEKGSPRNTSPSARGGKSANIKSTKKSTLPPIVNIIASEAQNIETNGTLSQNSLPVPKNLKIVLSPLNSDTNHVTKNGFSDTRNSHISPQTSPHAGSQGKKVIKSSPKLTSSTTEQGRKTTSRTVKTPEKDKNYFNSLNMSGQIAVAINYNNYAASSGVMGKCSVCNKAEDKKNLVMCDDCSLEFHFTCVPPYMPYNPKRRGYKWVCERCADSSDDDLSFGEIRENVSQISQ